MRINPHPDIAELNDRAFRAGVRISEVFTKAGADFGSWSHWRRGKPHLSTTLVRLNHALDQIISEAVCGEQEQH